VATAIIFVCSQARRDRPFRRDQPEHILTKHEALTDVIEAYRHFDTRDAGWIKVELRPAA
jgi:hypothetical protein